MKPVAMILKLLAALAAIAGIVYVIATYGDKIVAWAKNLLDSTCCCGKSCCCAAENADEAEAVAVESEEEAPVEAPVSEETVQADEADFEA